MITPDADKTPWDIKTIVKGSGFLNDLRLRGAIAGGSFKRLLPRKPA